MYQSVEFSKSLEIIHIAATYLKSLLLLQNSKHVTKIFNVMNDFWNQC